MSILFSNFGIKLLVTNRINLGCLFVVKSFEWYFHSWEQSKVAGAMLGLCEATVRH